MVSVKLHYGTKFFFVYVSRFQKDLLCVGNCAGFTEIVKYAFHYNGDCLFENFIHYFWRHTSSNFVHFSSKSMYIIMVERGRINIMQKFFKTLYTLSLNYVQVIYYLTAMKHPNNRTIKKLNFKNCIQKNRSFRQFHIICCFCESIEFQILGYYQDWFLVA